MNNLEENEVIEVKEETDKEETIKEETIKEETDKEETVKEETVKEETVKEETIKEETIKEETIKEELMKDQIIFMQVNEIFTKTFFFIKGSMYIDTVKNIVKLIDEQRVRYLLNLMVHIIKNNLNYFDNERDNTLEELSLIAAVHSLIFYKENTYIVNVLLDIKFYAENIFNIIQYIVGNSILLKPFKNCSDILKERQDDLYKSIDVLSNDLNKEDLIRIKDLLLKNLILLLITNNGSNVYRLNEEDEKAVKKELELEQADILKDE